MPNELSLWIGLWIIGVACRVKGTCTNKTYFMAIKYYGINGSTLRLMILYIV